MSFKTILFAVFCLFALQLSVSDIKTKTVFRSVIIADAIFLSVLRFAECFVFTEMFPLIFELAEFLIFPLVAFLFMRFVKSVTRGGLGEGDVLFAIPCGIFCGKNIFFGLFLSAALAGVFLVIRMFPTPSSRGLLRGTRNERERTPNGRMAEKIPFIPFMCVGVIAAYFLPVA